MVWYIGRKGPVGMRDVYRTIAPAILAATGSLIALVLLRQWMSMFAYLPVRLALALCITAALSLLVFTALPTGRVAMKSFSMALNFSKRGRESVA